MSHPGLHHTLRLHGGRPELGHFGGSIPGGKKKGEQDSPKKGERNFLREGIPGEWGPEKKGTEKGMHNLALLHDPAMVMTLSNGGYLAVVVWGPYPQNIELGIDCKI